MVYGHSTPGYHPVLLTTIGDPPKNSADGFCGTGKVVSSGPFVIPFLCSCSQRKVHWQRKILFALFAHLLVSSPKSDGEECIHFTVENLDIVKSCDHSQRMFMLKIRQFASVLDVWLSHSVQTADDPANAYRRS